MKLSKNRILANADNRITTIGAAHHRPSTDLRLIAQQRTGGGRLEISGLFTGDADVVIEAEITSGTGGQLAARAQTQGVGSGTVRVDTIRDNAAPGTLRFALADSGEAATAATLDFYGATLAAKAEGEAGNDLTITCQRALTLRPTHFSLLNPIAAGETELTGDEYDWGQPAGASHTVPDGALRIQFAGHAQVHRAWKSWQDGRFVYHLSPAPELEITTGTRVLAVTGDYTLTVRNGTATEIYPSCVTIYDFLAALQARSALVTVQSAVTADRAPGGMAATEIPLITDAHARPATGAPEGVTVEVAQVASGAGTENLTLRNIGGSRWSVTGAISGELGTARAGEPFSSSAVTFTIFDKRTSDAASGASSSNAATDARIRWKYNPTSRDKNEPLPTLCMKPIVRGINAVDKTVTFRYTKRPEKDCPCDDLPDLVLPAACLGLLTTGGLTMLPPEGNQRRGALFGWLAQFTAGNLLLRGENIDSDAVDIDLADACVKPLNAALEQIYNKASDETARDAALVIWDAAFEDLKNDLNAYAAITRNDYGLWGEWEKGRQYVNTLNGHLYEVVRILADGDEIEAMIALGIWPARGKADWKTDGSEFTLTASANQQQQAGTQTVTVTLQHLGAPLTGSGGTFVVGREITKQGYDDNDKPDPARTLWKITAITLDGAPADSVQGFSTTDDVWLDTNRYDKWSGGPVSGTDATGKDVTVTFAPLDTLSAGQYVVGREVQNSTGTDCWRVVALTSNGAATGAVTASGLPSMFDAAWLKDAVDISTPGEEFTLSNAVADNTFAVTFKDLGPVPTGAFSLKDYDRLGRYGSTVGSTTSASASESSASDKTTRTSESSSSSESSKEDDGKPISSGSGTPWYQTPDYPRVARGS